MDFHNTKIIEIPLASRTSKSVHIPEGVQFIPNYYFVNDHELEVIHFPSSIKHIGDYAFRGCSSLLRVVLPEGVSSIGVGCFFACVNMKTINIPNSVHEIKKKTFEQCKSLSVVTLPLYLECIGDNAFRGCLSLQMVNIPEGVRRIGVGCFFDCINMKTLNLPESNCDIKKWAFRNCKRLSVVTIPFCLESIADFCFFGCEMLEYVIISFGTKSIGKGAFAECTNLKEINFPNNIINISQSCFRGCFSLKRMTFPNLLPNIDSKVQRLGNDAFHACYSLVEINLTCYPVHMLDQSCFEHCENLETVILSKETKELMVCCFCMCSSLKYIGYESTLNCTEKTDARLGLDLEHIDVISSSAFLDCLSLKSVRLYDNNFVRYNCFEGCFNLQKILLPSDLPMEITSDGEKYYDFFPSNNITELILPSEAKNFSSSIIFYIMYKIIQRNPCLLEKTFTPEKLYPHEVVNNWLSYECEEREIPDDAWIANILYFYIRNSPHLFKII